MRNLFWRTVALLILSTTLLAQTPPVPAQGAVSGPPADPVAAPAVVHESAAPAVVQQSPVPAIPAAQSNSLHLPAGQRIDLVLKTEVSSDKSKVGDVVELEVIRPVEADGLVAIARDTLATARVVIAEPRRRKGVGGKLAIAFDGVQLVSGEQVALSGKEQRLGNNKREEINGDMAGWTFQTFGFGAPLAPLFLLQKGGRAMVESGTRLSAYLGSDVVLERSVLERHQPLQAQDRAVVYVIGGWHTTCGSQALPFDDYMKGVVRIDLPPGQYWFHNGATIGYLRAVMTGAAAGFTMGAAMPSPFSMKKVLKRPLREFLMMEVLAGHTYYLSAWGATMKAGIKQLEPIDGEKLLQDAEGPYYRVSEVSPEMLRNLAGRPHAAPSKP